MGQRSCQWVQDKTAGSSAGKRTRASVAMANWCKVQVKLERERVLVRGLHSSSFRLNLRALYGIGGARRGCLARFKGDGRGCLGCVGCFLVSDTA